jgi:hypothetical protein
MISLLNPPDAHRSHLSEGTIIRKIAQELSPAGSLRERQHLYQCRHCEARAKRLARASRRVSELRQNGIDRLGPLPSARRDLFVRQLDEMPESIPARPWWRVLPFTHAVPGFGKFAPSFKVALVIVMCAGLILFPVGRGHFQTVSAAEFLNRATALDQNAAKITGSEVMRRRFRVKTEKNTFEHDAYRDISDSRQLRPVKGEPEDADLTARLALAGGEWDDPLSAVSFKAWHDRQVNPVDEVHSSGGGLLTAGTRAASSSIAREPLTVRQDGFHPVERTVEF